MRTQPTYKAVIKRNRTGKSSKHVAGGKVMTVNIIQTGTRPAGRTMLRLSDLRSR